MSRTIVLADVETTGEDPEVDQICELGLGWIDETGAVVHPAKEALCGITVSMQPVARAVHHIDPAKLAGLPPACERLGCLWRLGAAAVAAHHAPFDVAFLRRPLWSAGFVVPPMLDTLRAARHVWPDAPRFGLQVLRYWLELPGIPPGVPHRAPYDVAVLAALTRRLLVERDLDELIRLSTTPVLLRTVGFGMHRGEEWARVPLDYLRWMAGKLRDDPKAWDGDTVYTADHWMNLKIVRV